MWVHLKNIDLASNVFVLTPQNTDTEWDKSQTLIRENRKWDENLWEIEI